MEKSDLFKDLTDHLLDCRIPNGQCETCKKVYGDNCPVAVVLARIYEFSKVRDDSTPKESE